MTPQPAAPILYLKNRFCRNCSGRIPKPTSNKAGVITRKKIFCSDNCRKEFHKNNGISVHKLKEQVQRWVRDEMVRSALFANLDWRLKALEISTATYPDQLSAPVKK